MSALTNFFGFLALHLVIGSSPINLDLTDWIHDSQSNVILSHYCLYIDTSIEKENDPYQIISYCISEGSSKWNIEVDNLIPRLTFNELYQLNITSEQLYSWSASLDVIERYQVFLNQISTSIVSLSMEEEPFFNCTLPRFGKWCQYSLDIWENHNVSLNTMISNYYQQEYNPTELTCYIHLQCNHGSDASCLDWSQICDNYIDCENGIDEKHCWQLEMNECEDNEYQCSNRQCISIDFLNDDKTTFECLDESDESNRRSRLIDPYIFLKGEPTFAQEDVTCYRRSPDYSEIHMTSSCVSGRDKLVVEAMFSNHPTSVSDDCWFAFKCLLHEAYLNNSTCDEFCEKWNCKNVVQKSCPDIFFFPNQPVAFGHLYFAYTKNAIIDSVIYRIPQYICYNDQLCGKFPSNKPILSFNNMTCRSPEDLPIILREYLMNPVTSAIKSVYLSLFKCNTILYDDSIVCNSSVMYRCINSSKCIPKWRVCNGFKDCTYEDDEQCFLIGDNCSKNTFLTLFRCSSVNMCIHPLLVEDGRCHCAEDEHGLCDDEITDMNYIRKHISFQTICDGSTELIPINIDGRNESDETECEHWKCDNIYTRCDGFWNCLNGMDELNCNLSSSSSLINCPFNHHICISPETNQLMCLSISKANDGNDDCLGATDEPILCRENKYRYNVSEFYCTSDAVDRCVNFEYSCYHIRCENGMNQEFCNNARKSNRYFYICPKINSFLRSDIRMFFCDYLVYNQKSQMVYFSLDQVGKTRTEDKNRMIAQSSTVKKEIRSYEQRCHRGLGLHVWLNHQQNRTCLCPSNYYGTRCQYQNERVSLTLQFGTYSDSRQTLFALVILLIDNDQERTIHSYHQMTYLYSRHCKIKFNIYLIYSTRPKNQTKNYSIHIDIYEKISRKYRGSFLSLIKFNFLPVHRLALHLLIPRTNDKIDNCIDHQCIHGRCIKYSNTKNETTFCQCDKGWSGKSCTISYLCTCSSDSICIGMLTNNRSLCVCPIDKWGSQCYLRSIGCQFETCLNGGTCVSINENVISEKKFLCICQKGFSGYRCERNDTKLILTFEQNIILPEYIFVHFIEVIVNNQHENGSTFKIIPINQNSVTLYWPRPFHIVFVQLNETNYYLIRVQKIYNQSETIIQTINSTNHCKYINEVFNETLLNLHLLRRIKYYHLPCQNQSLNLSCFYDETYFCLCYDFGSERLANCFEFYTKKKLNCRGESNCENGAECLQDRNTCPQTSVCVCPKCFYGTRCQFSSNLFGLSLDAILGYYIQPNISILFQPLIVQISLVFTIIISLGGLINGLLCLITFKNKETCQAPGQTRIPVQISSDEFRSVLIGSVDFQRIPGRNFAELTGTFPTKSGPESCSKEIVGIQRSRPKINGIYRIRCRKTKKTTGSGGRNGGPGAGSGLYLFTTAIITLVTIIIFLLKFVILLMAQIIYIQNRTFLYLQCYSIDFLLQVGLNIDRWLCACVAIERGIASIQGTTFNKKKSKKISKYMILIVLLLTMMTYIPDPIHRRLIDDNENDEERIWCIITYSSHFQIFNSIINIVHFFLPLIINFMSPIIIIKVQIKQRFIVQPDQIYRRVFYEQCQRHSHLLIASVVLVILSIPRLIISFISTCLKSNNQNSWLFLFGYLISFIPLVLHFILFVVPSKLFKEEFQKCLKHYRRLIRRRLHRTF